MTRLPVEFRAAVEAHKIAETPQIVWVSVAEQRLRVFENGRCVAEYPVSTAKNGVGCRNGSYQTPLGLHRIAEKIGEGQPLGMIFRERTPIGVWRSDADPASDLILTRILWLEGLEPGRNQGGEVDTFQRYIYLHGTNHESLIGQPASRGCIRLRNADVQSLCASVERKSLVWIDAITPPAERARP